MESHVSMSHKNFSFLGWIFEIMINSLEKKWRKFISNTKYVQKLLEKMWNFHQGDMS